MSTRKSKQYKIKSVSNTVNLSPAKIIFEDNVDRTHLPPKDVWMYVILPYLSGQELVELRETNHRFHRLVDTQLARSIQIELDDPNLTYRDALWYYYQLLIQRPLIVKTAAMKIYRVTHKQLIDIPCELRDNRFYGRRSAPIILYCMKDILRACFNRHKNVQGLLDYRIKLENKEEKRADTIEMKKEQRRKELYKELGKLNITPREGDPFVKMYINKTRPRRYWHYDDEYWSLDLPSIIKKLIQIYTHGDDE